MSDDKVYEILEEGNDIVRGLKDRYPKILWAVVPENIVVLAVTNKLRPWGMKKLAVICLVNPAMRTVIKQFGRRNITHIVEVYVSDWNTWNDPRKQVILFHELLHVTKAEKKTLLHHDIEQFGILLDAFGIDFWLNDSLPNLLSGSPFPFRQELADRLHVSGRDDDSEATGDDEESHGNNHWGAFSAVDFRRPVPYDTGLRRSSWSSKIRTKIAAFFTRIPFRS